MPMPRVALLLSNDLFESFYGQVMGLNREEYLRSYRNDVSWDHVRGLGSRGTETILYTPTLHEGGYYETHDGFCVRFIPVSSWYRLWIRYPVLARTPVGRYVAEYANCIAFLAGLKRALVSDGIDVLYLEDYWTGRFDCLTRNVEIPIIGVDQGGRAHRQLKFMKRAAFRSACAVTCQTPDEMKDVVRYGGKPTYLPNGIDVDFFSPGDEQSDPDPRSILTVARLTNAQKRTSDLIAALSCLDREWSLSIVGRGPDEGMLSELATDLGVSERVRFLGFINDQSVLRSYYSSCGVFALPSANEGLPLAALEAMSCGAAVTVSDIRAFGELVKDGVNGVKVPVGDPKSLAEGILRASELRDRIGSEARRHVVENFSHERFSDKLSGLISDCSRSHRGRTGH